MFNNLKNLIVSRLFKDFIVIDNHILKRNNISSISDFFYYDVENFNTSFSLDNNLSILAAKKFFIDVDLFIFDKVGNLCLRKNFIFNDFYKDITFDQFSNDIDQYGGFFFNLKSDHQDIVKFRGYSHYFCKENQTKSSVHGNFGALSYNKVTKSVISLATRSKKFFYYSPQTLIAENQKFIFLNHFNIEVEIDFCTLNRQGNLFTIDTLKIPPMGTSFFDTNKYIKKSTILKNSIPTFKSKSPHLRPLIFETYLSSFDIHHS